MLVDEYQTTVGKFWMFLYLGIDVGRLAVVVQILGCWLFLTFSTSILGAKTKVSLANISFNDSRLIDLRPYTINDSADGRMAGTKLTETDMKTRKSETYSVVHSIKSEHFSTLEIYAKADNHLQR